MRVPKNYKLISSSKDSVAVFYKQSFVQSVAVDSNYYVSILNAIKAHQKQFSKGLVC